MTFIWTAMPNLTIFGNPDKICVDQLTNCMNVAGEDPIGVLCADAHKGYGMPVGGVLASSEVVLPEAVGYDIGCGNLAVKTPILYEDIHDSMSGIMDEIFKNISFGMGRKNPKPVDSGVFEHIAHSPVKEQRGLLSLARDQFGTVGGGNHYVDLFRDRRGFVWVGVHFGSRGFGWKTCAGFLALAEGNAWGDRVKEVEGSTPKTFGLETPIGQSYLAGMRTAGLYAKAGRQWVVDYIVKEILKTTATDHVHNHHNYAWEETHGGRQLCVMRKGSTPAMPGMRGFVGSNMRDTSVILEGIKHTQTTQALCSTVHGAGRTMSRTAAKGSRKVTHVWACADRECMGRLPGNHHEHRALICPTCQNPGMQRLREVKIKKPGCVDFDKTRQEMLDWRIVLRGGGPDEAPPCYKNLQDVLAHHTNTVRVTEQLYPIGVAMAGEGDDDPYKD